jgi:hypothetical protein
MNSTQSGAAIVGAGSALSNSTHAKAPSAMGDSGMANLEMLNRLPALDDDDNVGKVMDHVIERDNQPNLKFHGALLASAAPDYRGQERWREYRVYKTGGGKYVFTRIGRSVIDGERDKFEAEVWKPDTSVKRWDSSNSEFIALTLKDAAADYFKFDQLAKLLYSKLKLDTTEQVD